jgi:PAS domain S-box-containing protein
MDKSKTKQQLLRENEELRTSLEEAEETLRAIGSGDVDAVVVSGTQGDRVYTLQGADRSYRILLETMEEGSATLSNDGTILYCNRRLAAMLGMSLEKVIGSPLEKYFSPVDWQALQRMFQKGNSATNRGKFHLRTAEGNRLSVLVSFGRLEVGDGHGVCLTVADLSEQRRGEEELRKACDELGIRVQKRTKELVEANSALKNEIEKRKRAEEALRGAKLELEIKIKERTAELQQTNEQLKEENQRRNRTEQSLRLEEARLDALLHLSQISEAPLKEVTGFTLEQAIGLTHSKIGFVGFLNEDESVYTLHAVSKDVVKECNVTGDPLQWHVVDAGIWADAIRERKTLFVNDYREPHPRKKVLPSGHPYIERLMVVPILEGGRIVAVAGVANKASDYDKTDERQIVLLLNGMWGYMQKNRSREELQKAYSELEERVKQRTAELAASAAALQEREKDLNRAQAVGQIGSWRLDVRRNVLTWSDENYRIFGVSRGTPMTYEMFLGTVHPDDRQYVDTQWKAGLRGEPYDIEHRIVADGRVKWVREKAYLEFDDGGNLLGGFGITQDITGRKGMEKELRQAEETSRLLIRHAPTIIYEIDFRVPAFKSVNDVMCRLLGYTRAELMAMNPFDLLDDEGKRVFQERIRRRLAGETISDSLEYKGQSKDGREFWALLNISFTEKDGQPEGAVVVAHDITQRKRMEEELRKSHDELEERVQERTAELKQQADLLDLARDAIVLSKIDGTILLWSDGAAEMYGWSKEEVLGKSMRQFLQTEYPLPRDEIISRLFRDFHWEGELTHTRKDGKKINVLSRWTLKRDSLGNPESIMIINHDITERLRLEEHLRQAQKMEAIGRLAGGIAHDFNNILQTIAINADLALCDLPAESGVRDNLELILTSGQRGRDLVRQMLLFGRKSQRKQEILPLTPLIKETFNLLRSSIPTTIQMNLRLATESDSAYADPSQIQQVIMNLCTNAAYAMRRTTGSMDISLQALTFGLTDLPEPDMQPGDYLVLSVKDTGSGMDEEVRKRIFEPFFTTKPVGEGTGLGLSVVYGIVKSHKGGIAVYSEPGKGSIFRVYIPKADTGVSQKAETLGPIPRGNERILFVDDEEIIVNSVRNMLQHLGYQVTALMDGEEALKVFSANPHAFDLVITDQTMPCMTGEDFGKQLMRIRPDLPVILCTGYSDLISAEKATLMGFRDFIMKPFTVREGAELVRRVLDEKSPR